MNKRQILASLSDIANSLDNLGLYKEANILSDVMKKVAQQQANGQQNQSNYANYKPIYDQCGILFNQIYDNFKKLRPILAEVRRKHNTGEPIQQSQNGYNALLQCNNILHNTKTLHAQFKNMVSQLQKLANPNDESDQEVVNHYKKLVNQSQTAIYSWSEIVNIFNSRIKQYQPMQTQQPAQHQVVVKPQ